MNYLEWNLDTEEGIDVYDPLGDLKILGDEGKIVEESTYLDAFFEALVEAVQNIEIGKSISVDPIVEPNNLEFDCQRDFLKVIYGQQQAILFQKNQFVKEVHEAVEELLKILDKQSEIAKQQKPKLVKLQNYFKHGKM